MRKNDSGYIVVETVGTFIPFLLLIIAILSLVNIVTLQARIHNALTQTAMTLSTYGYVLHATGVADGLITADQKGEAAAESIDAVISGIESLSKGTISIDDGERILSSAELAVSDPKGMIQSFANYGVSQLQGLAVEQLVRPIMGRYLANGTMSGDEYLNSVMVVDFNYDYTDCYFVDKDGNVKLTVHYEVEYVFGIIQFSFGPTLRITQTATTKAWLGGSGEGYSK
ncbi:MAG: hypothetical protein FWD05_01110 [Oscillospiraceae bacterium]|nr:hypothetical protein [Oscillospiraceae bacterium]